MVCWLSGISAKRAGQHATRRQLADDDVVVAQADEAVDLAVGDSDVGFQAAQGLRIVLLSLLTVQFQHPLHQRGESGHFFGASLVGCNDRCRFYVLLGIRFCSFRRVWRWACTGGGTVRRTTFLYAKTDLLFTRFAIFRDTLFIELTVRCGG